MADEVEFDVLTASEDLIMSLKMSDLRDTAIGLGVKVTGKTRTQLTEEIVAARDALLALEGQPGESLDPESSNGETEVVEPTNPELPPMAPSVVESAEEESDEITPDEARHFDKASTDDIYDWLARRQDEARACLVTYAYLVLERRRKESEELAKRAALESQVEQFEVIKGGKVGIGGFWTNLPSGSVVARHTHDLEALKAQGIEIRPVQKVSSAPDDIGIVRTKIEL